MSEQQSLEPLRPWVVVYVEYRNQIKRTTLLAYGAEDAIRVFADQRQEAARRLNKPYLATNYTITGVERTAYYD